MSPKMEVQSEVTMEKRLLARRLGVGGGDWLGKMLGARREGRGQGK